MYLVCAESLLLLRVCFSLVAASKGSPLAGMWGLLCYDTNCRVRVQDGGSQAPEHRLHSRVAHGLSYSMS